MCVDKKGTAPSNQERPGIRKERRVPMPDRIIPPKEQERCTTQDLVELQSDYGIPMRDLTAALRGVKRSVAVAACEYVLTTGAKAPYQKGDQLTKWAKRNNMGMYSKSTTAPPTGGLTVTPVRKERMKFSNKQIAKNLARFGEDIG